MNLLSAWVFGVIVTLAPSTKYRKTIEPEADMNVRYHQIADDMVEAIQTSKPLFTGDKADLQEAALLTSIAWFESGFRKDVGDGRVRGDAGSSWCYMQHNIGGGHIAVGDEDMQKWTGKDLVKDNKKCFKAGIEVLRHSMKECASYKGSDVISMYTSGKCSVGEKHAKNRWLFAGQIVTDHPFEVKKDGTVD
jgi:hypothetical protein